MNVISRGVRNAFRNGIRSVSIIVILGLSVGLALSMLIVRQAVQAKIDTVKSTIGNTITVSPAGARGLMGGGEPLTTDQLAIVKGLDHIVSVNATLNATLNSDNSNLESAIEPGTLGTRNNKDGEPTVKLEGPGAVNGDFKLPIMATGTDNPSDLSSSGGGTLNVISGEAFASGSTENVAIVGSGLAAKNNISAGSTFEAHGQTIKVVGVYDTGNKFGNSGLMLPLITLQRLTSQTSEISTMTVTVDSIENIASVQSAIENKLGDAADVVSQQDTSQQALEPLENIKSITLFSLVSAVIAGAVIILLIMIMVVRERRREIGVLKAIGASNMRVMLQFMTESVTLTTLGAIVGVGIGLVAASPLTQLLVTSSTNTAGPAGERGFKMGLSQDGGLSLQTINVTIGWDILAYGLASALVIAIIGSAGAAWLISKIRPAEVMRTE